MVSATQPESARPVRRRYVIGDGARDRQRDVGQVRAAGRVVDRERRRAVLVPLDQQPLAVRREPAGQVGAPVGHQPAQLAAGHFEPGDPGELPVVVRAEIQRRAVRRPAQRSVHRRRVRRGHRGEPLLAGRHGEVHQRDVLRVGGDLRMHGDREQLTVGRDSRLAEHGVGQHQLPLGSVCELADDRIEVDPVPAVDEVADLPRPDVGEHVHAGRVAHHRLQVGQRGGRPGRKWQPQQGQLVLLVAALVMGHDHGPLAGQVAPGARARQRGQRGRAAVRGYLNQLGGAGVVAAGQHPARRVEVKRTVEPDIQQPEEVTGHNRPRGRAAGVTRRPGRDRRSA